MKQIKGARAPKMAMVLDPPKNGDRSTSFFQKAPQMTFAHCFFHNSQLKIGLRQGQGRWKEDFKMNKFYFMRKIRFNVLRVKNASRKAVKTKQMAIERPKLWIDHRRIFQNVNIYRQLERRK
jgi:hypothetical protein